MRFRIVLHYTCVKNDNYLSTKLRTTKCMRIPCFESIRCHFGFSLCTCCVEHQFRFSRTLFSPILCIFMFIHYRRFLHVSDSLGMFNFSSVSAIRDASRTLEVHLDEEGDSSFGASHSPNRGSLALGQTWLEKSAPLFRARSVVITTGLLLPLCAF